MARMRVKPSVVADGMESGSDSDMLSSLGKGGGRERRPAKNGEWIERRARDVMKVAPVEDMRLI